MHSTGSITRKFGPSWKQSTGQTSTQSVYLQRMQFSTTTKGMVWFRWGWRAATADIVAAANIGKKTLQATTLAAQPRRDGREACREREGKNVEIQVVGVAVKK